LKNTQDASSNFLFMRVQNATFAISAAPRLGIALFPVSLALVAPCCVGGEMRIVLRAATYSLPFLLACVSAHAQERLPPPPQFTAVSAIGDWLSRSLGERPPPPEPPLAADTGAPPHRRATPSLRLPPPRSAELAPTSVPPNKTATVPINVLTQQRSGLR
jgi:hypothetical protein